jgi:hypothetical protein
MRRACNQDRSVRGFSWCVRRASDRSPVHAPPFSAARRAMCLDRGGVNRQGHAIPATHGQRLEDRLSLPIACGRLAGSAPAIAIYILATAVISIIATMFLKGYAGKDVSAEYDQ